MIRAIAITYILISLTTFPATEIPREPVQIAEDIPPPIAEDIPPEPLLESLGNFKITMYTAGFESCGKYPDDPEYGITRSGARVQENHTIASDWAVLPEGTRVMIEGFGNTIYTVEDIGGLVNGKHIDIYVLNLERANRWGLKKREVWLVK